MSARRAERRRAARAAAKRPAIIVGDNIVATEFEGHPMYEALPRAQLAPKVPGQHRWIVTAAWSTTVDVVEKAHDVDSLKFMDNENLVELAIGCWDCERPLGQIQPGSRCPAGDEWTRK